MHLRLFVALVALALVGTTPFTVAAPPPVIDGNLGDLLAYGATCGLILTDPAQDICKTDVLIIPCVVEVPCIGGSAPTS